MDHFEAIDAGNTAKSPLNEIARKIFLSYPTAAFSGNEELEFEIMNSISMEFGVPISCVHVAGSAKTGKSFYKGTNFTPGVSDLDAAIIDTRLYTHFFEEIFSATRGYSQRQHFPIKHGKITADEYLAYMQKGICRLDLLPYGPLRVRCEEFFNRLSNKHIAHFSKISGVIYATELFFESKQRTAIKNYLLSGIKKV